MNEAAVTPGVPGRLQFLYRLSHGVAVVDVRGEVDISTCVLLRERLLLALTDRDRRSMVVNLADVSFIDSAGIGVLVEVWHRAQADPGGYWRWPRRRRLLRAHLLPLQLAAHHRRRVRPPPIPRQRQRRHPHRQHLAPARTLTSPQPAGAAWDRQGT